MSAFFDPSSLTQLFFLGAGDVSSKLSLNWTIFTQAFFFLVSFAILSRYFFPPVMEVLLQRQKMVDQAHQELKRYEHEGQEMERDYQDHIRNARKEAQGIHKEARAEASDQERTIIEQARSEAAQVMYQREHQARQQRDSLRANLDQDAEKLAKDIASKVLGRSLR